MPNEPCGRPSSSTKKDNNYYLKKLYVKYTVPAETESEDGGDAKLESEDEEPELEAESAGETKTKKFIKASKLNYKTAFKLKVPESVKKIKISATAACEASSKKKGAAVEGAGQYDLDKGTNEFIVVCKASTGVKRNYKITVIRG
jgi:hypothetical protein